MMKTYSDYVVEYKEYGGFDVRLVCQKEVFYTHRLILSAGSKFFSSIFKSSGFEDDEFMTILLPDFDVDQVKGLVHILYNYSDINEHSPVPQIFNDLYFNDVRLNIQELKVECEPVLEKLSHELSTDDDQMDLKEQSPIPLNKVKLETKFEKEDREPTKWMRDEWLEDTVFEEKRKSHSNNQVNAKKRGRPREYKTPKKDMVTGRFCCIECKNAGLKKTKWNFFSESRYQLHLKIHYVKDANAESFPCNQCDYVGNSIKYLKRHIVNHHSEGNTVSCKHEGCGQSFKSNYYMQYHYVVKHGGNRFVCDRCPFTSKFGVQLKLHQQREHDGVKFICDKCGLEAPNPNALRHHIKQVHEGVTYPCADCDFIGASYSSYMHHLNRAHKPKQFLCDQCSFSSSDRGGLNTHVKRVHTEKSYTCHLCDFTTKLKWSLKRHQEGKHKRELETSAENF